MTSQQHKVTFIPDQLEASVDSGTKILLAAKRAKADIRFGCASCRCGTCAISATPSQNLSPMKDDELKLLTRMKLALDGSVRLSCQAKVCGDVSIDLNFQNLYDPDDGDFEQ